MSGRTIIQRVQGRPTSDGAGVRLTRIMGIPPLTHLDPFLMLDEFGSEEGADYIGGFPDHPHRGFETVTIMLNGAMHHQDSMGNSGHLRDGSVQWMTAGSGIIHSEMPEQTEGLMRGFQLWVNLPASHKMCEPRYQDITAQDIPIASLPAAQVRVLAGQVADQIGPITGVVTEPTLVDITVTSSEDVEIPVPAGHSAFVYCYEGGIRIDDQPLYAGTLGVLSAGDHIVFNGEKDSRVLLCAARPIGETIARWGPFVMNTESEIRQAMADYRTGQLVRNHGR